jgi:hypothetical protein
VNGELAQAVALVAHGNLWLSGTRRASVDIAHFEARNSTFQYVRSITFETRKRRNGTGLATSVVDWLDAVQVARIRRLSLLAGRAMPVTFAGEGAWGILGHGERRDRAWYPSWSVNRDGVDPDDHRPRIWEICYRLRRRFRTSEPKPVDLEARRDQLRGALDRATEFARDDPYLSTFAPWFEEAKQLGTSSAPVIPWHSDMLPTAGYPLAARQLIAMGARSWVFGGMGSWNDVGFSEAAKAAEYKDVSQRLYRAILDGIRDAANSFDEI